MDKLMEAEKTTKPKYNTAYYKAEITRTLAEIRRIAEETDKSQAETARLRIETREILDRLKVELNVS